MRQNIFINIILCAFLFGLALSFEIDLNEELLKAENDIKEANVAQMMAGAKSSRTNRKKFTAE